MAADDVLSQKHNSLLIFVEVDEHEVQENCEATIRKYVQLKHQAGCEILFIRSGTMDAYKQEGKVMRFTFRDQYVKGRLQDQILLHCSKQDNVIIELEDDSDDGITCGECFTADQQLETLDIESFDILHEWATDVPLYMQMSFEPFLNAHSVQRATDIEHFLKQKLLLLYSGYDTLLHNMNKMYCGLLQKANTDELIMGNKSVETVFSITSGAGASTSLNVAERQLKAKALKDELYYEAYLKPYNMMYETDAGMVTKGVRMRDCLVILMLDNLVRLKHNDDPNRGENRSKQLNLLPITIQGLPKDSAILTQFHNSLICDGSECCPCKKPTTINKEDVSTVILNLSDDEIAVRKKFEKLCTWGNSKLWPTLFNDGKKTF